MRTPVLETEKLHLRPIKAADINEIYNCWMQDEDISRYMYWKASDDINATKDFVESELLKITDDIWFRWIIILKQTGKIIGTCLIYYNDEENCWDISYNLGKPYWGHGYIYEAMTKVFTFANNELHIKEFIAIHAALNAASGRVIEKLGFEYEKDVPFVCNGGEIKTTGKYYRLAINK